MYLFFLTFFSQSSVILIVEIFFLLELLFPNCTFIIIITRAFIFLSISLISIFLFAILLLRLFNFAIFVFAQPAINKKNKATAA